ncbi:MAG: right-handed parallel beta-helix repeat-containing protein, partial [Methanosarcinales archaeon]
MMKYKISLKLLTVSVVLVLVLSSVTPSTVEANTTNDTLNPSGSISSSTVVYVPDDYEKIQWAVDNASTGDSVIVRNGSYTENIVVDKAVTIWSEKGATNCTVTALDPNEPVFELNANSVTMIGLKIEGANDSCGILIAGVTNSKISYNNVTGNFLGISLDKSSQNSIVNNTVCSNKDCGIKLANGSSHNQLIWNDVFNNINQGIGLWTSSENTLTLNYAMNNTQGICLTNSNKNMINDNVMHLNYRGIAGIGVWSSRDNTITGNAIQNNSYGIYLSDSSNINITDNDVYYNYHRGIGFSASDTNTITNNRVMVNEKSGIYFTDSG